MRFFATACSIALLASCTSSKQKSEELDSKKTLEWINSDASLKTTIIFMQDSLVDAQLTNIRKSLQENFYENWLMALKLLKIEIAQFSAASPSGGPTLKLDGLTLTEQTRNEIRAGAGLTALGGENLSSPGNQAPTPSPQGFDS